MYLTGEISTETEGYAQLLDMQHSTFDKSKFDLVGTPVVTDDGIASGFKAENYPRTVRGINFATQVLEIGFSFTPEAKQQTIYSGVMGISATSSENFILGINTSETNKYRMVYGIGDASGTFWNKDGLNELLPDIKHYIKILIDDLNVNIYTSTDRLNWILDAAGTILTPLTRTRVLTFGVDRSGIRPLSGTIDLKDVYVKYFNNPVFSGCKTGIDTIKPDEYEIVGSPVVSDIGLASGTNVNNQIKYGNFDFKNTCSVKFKFCITGIDSSNNAALLRLYDASNNSEILMFITINGNLNMSYKVKGGSAIYSAFGVPELNKEYEVTLEINNNNFKATLSQNNEIIKSIEKDEALELTNFSLVSGSTILGSLIGYIDLNSVKIYTDGKLIYQPCLKIPYTLSKTGSKIVDALYRDRVGDVYEEYGQARYYTLDVNNKNFTLPMGEIYGMLEKQTTNLPIGAVIPTMASKDYVPENCLPCDGGEYSGDLFPDFYNDYLLKGKLLTCSYEEYETEETTYGKCGKFGLDTVNKKFKVPYLPDGTHIQQAMSDEEPGKSYNAALPNITGTIGFNGTDGGYKASGAFSTGTSYGGAGRGHDSGTHKNPTFEFNASSISSIYSNDVNTVQTEAVALRWFVVISNQSINKSAMDWSQWASSLSYKANKTDVDGQWVGLPEAVTLTKDKTSGEIEIDLSEYLPDDNYNYNVKIAYYFENRNSTGVRLFIKNDVIPEYAQATAGETMGTAVRGYFELPITSSRTFIRNIESSIYGFELKLLAYRRIGKNE